MPKKVVAAPQKTYNWTSTTLGKLNNKVSKIKI